VGDILLRICQRIVGFFPLFEKGFPRILVFLCMVILLVILVIAALVYGVVAFVYGSSTC
jgi:hypothetical protein